jgi:hypothetical protein
MKTILSLLIGLLLTASLSASVRAFEKGACEPDIEKYCKDVPIVGGKLKECLQKHIHELSDPCKANLLDLYLEKKQQGK